MSASTPQEIVEVLDGLEACADRLSALDFDACGTGELLSIIEGMQRVVRKLRVPGHAVVNQLGVVATGQELGGTLGQALADRLRITKAEADRRIAEAAVL
ncbi:DUF222 domain-containing protein, partial [Mycobacterium asiaticum]|uniref:DUF222 domain-containing protein n=1 Tax=Mycobacterium asiaticum TaxID=1790 RepID=UPI0012DB03B2